MFMIRIVIPQIQSTLTESTYALDIFRHMLCHCLDAPVEVDEVLSLLATSISQNIEQVTEMMKSAVRMGFPGDFRLASHCLRPRPLLIRPVVESMASHMLLGLVQEMFGF